MTSWTLLAPVRPYSAGVLYLFGFERIGVVLSDLYFVDPNPEPGQEGAERGVRLELRHLRAGELNGSIYSARPVGIEEPIWRADLLERAEGPPASFGRTHHHPRFRGWEPTPRAFVPELSADPVEWVGERLRDPEPLLREARVDIAQLGARDVADLQAAVPEILECLRRTLTAVHEGRLATAPDSAVDSARLSWL
jgi:hypothetical protein